MSNLVLIGFMGAGKSSIGKALARSASMRFVDTDERVAKEADLSIPRIFEGSGEKHFRQLESKVVSDVAEMDDAVIATGGGVVLNDKNIEKLKKNGVIIYICLTESELIRRVRDLKDRPLLKDLDKDDTVHKLMKVRGPLYRKYADYIIDGNYPVNAIVEKINEAVFSDE